MTPRLLRPGCDGSAAGMILKDTVQINNLPEKVWVFIEDPERMKSLTTLVLLQSMIPNADADC